jgi:predicted O-methyltransferase YrrM
MKRGRLLILVVCAAVLGLNVLLVYSAEQPQKKSEAFRKQFIENFHRIGLNTTPGDAMMLRILVESSKAKRGVEVGTSTGFGAINMGIAFERNGGHLWTHDIDPAAVKEARANLEKVGLENVVTVVEGDALKTMPDLEGPLDFVFIDALKSDYFKYLKILEPKLKPGAVVVADNVIKSAKAMKDFLDYIENSPDYDTVTIRASMEKNDGMTISYKIR